MEALIDWLSFTVKQFEGQEATPEKVIKDILNLDIGMFQLKPGRYGYTKQYNYNCINVYFDGREDMGVHVGISSKGIRFLESTPGFNWTEFFYLLLNWFHVKITRLDVAVDETEGILDLDYINEKIQKAHVVSRWKNGIPIPYYNLHTGLPEGYTIYFGTRQSEILCRFYNKREEQREKYTAQGKELPEHWIRCELEMHNERAVNFIAIYTDKENKKSLGELFSGVLSNYMRITDGGTDDNKSRWKNSPVWEKFINAVEKVKLTTAKIENSLEETWQWFLTHMSQTLARLYLSTEKKLEMLVELISYGISHLPPRYVKEIIERRKIETGKEYTSDNWKHDLKEKMYNTEWQIMERKTSFKKINQMLELLFHKRQQEFVQIKFI